VGLTKIMPVKFKRNAKVVLSICKTTLNTFPLRGSINYLLGFYLTYIPAKAACFTQENSGKNV